MKDIIFDCSKVTDKASLFVVLSDLLPLPSYFGGNLDALNDFLSQTPNKYRFIIKNPKVLSEALGKYAEKFTEVLKANCEVIDFNIYENKLRRNIKMAKKIRVTVWNEFRHEREKENVREIYPNGIHYAIKDFLSSDDTLQVTPVALDDPDNGLPDELLNNTDVLVWWGHMAHDEVPDELAQKIHDRVVNDGMGFVALHSAHHSKPFISLLGTPCDLCWGANQPEIMWTIMKNHPVAEGVPEYIHIESEELYGEPFNIPQPDELVFMSWYKAGYVFRSGCAWYRGMGKIFYFQPGHETCRSFYNKDLQKIINNAIHWAAPTNFGSKYEVGGPHVHSLTKKLGIEPKIDDDDID